MPKPLLPEELQQALDLMAQHGSFATCARELGMSSPAFRHRYTTAVRRGLTPLPTGTAVPDGFEITRLSSTVAKGEDGSEVVKKQFIQARPAGTFEETVPEGHIVKGVSTLVDESGKTRAQWVKTGLDEWKRAAMVQASLKAAAEAIAPLPASPLNVTTNDDLATQYTLTDCHVGMLAWTKETGEPWDLEIAERVLTETLFAMIDAAPFSALGILNQLGDFLHFDSMKPVTPEHGHLLDADSRYQKVVEVAVRIIVKGIRYMLLHHERVHVLMNEGNHDPAGSIWLRIMLAMLFKDEPRVTVEQSPRPYVVIPWGDCMLAYHHGHLSKNNNLPLLFAAMFPELWGRTKHRYINTGHRHHIEEKEHPGVLVVQHPTLAAPDAYAIRGGWISKRQASSITYHKKRGEIARGIHLPAE